MTTKCTACATSSHQQDGAGVGTDLLLEIGDRDDDHQVVHDVLGEPQAHRGENPTRITLEHLDHAVRHGLDPLDFLLRLEEDRRVADLGADVVADEHHHGRQPERDPPSPRQEGRLGQRRGQHQQHHGGEHVADRHGRLRPAGPEGAAAVRAVLGHQQHRATPLAADGEALEEPQHHQQRRRPVADLPEGRQAAHQERDGTDQQKAELQQFLAPVLVTEVSEHDAAERAREEPDRIREERREDRVQVAAGLREEHLVEDERGRGAVEEELVPLDDRAGHRRGHHSFEAGRDWPAARCRPAVAHCESSSDAPRL